MYHRLYPDIEICQYRSMSKSLLELTPVEAVACCSPVTREPLSADAAERIAPLVKAIADPVRLRDTAGDRHEAHPDIVGLSRVASADTIPDLDCAGCRRRVDRNR